MSDTFLTIETPAEGLFKDKGSRFAAYAYPLSAADSSGASDEAARLIQTLRTQHHDARHHCYAWRFGADGSVQRSSDDGEPPGTAARPIMGQLLSRELTDILVVVVRWFGGTKLGVPGLIAAYKEATADALDRATVIEKTVQYEITVKFSYLVLNSVMKAVKESGARILSQDFDNDSRLRLSIRQRDAEALRSRLAAIGGVAVE